MLTNNVLFNCLTLLYRESLLPRGATDSSKDLVKTIINIDKELNKRMSLGRESDYLTEFTNLINDYIEQPDNYDETTLLEVLEFIHKDRLEHFHVIEKMIKAEMTQAGLKKSILSLRNRLNNFYKECEFKRLINVTQRNIAMNKLGDEGLQSYIAKLIVNLEALTTVSKGKDPAIIDEIDMSDENSIKTIVNKVVDQSDNTGVLRTGWKELNRITQGGFRRREMWVINALQHNYKSGTLQSLFVQLATLNIPIMKDPEKKPMILYISFEDNSDVYTEFMYKYMYYSENKVLPVMKDVTKEDVTSYLYKKLSCNGYTPVTMRVDPLRWTYRELFDKILEFEANGFEIHACIIDYLAKLPTTGCNNSGPGGTDVRDLFQRCRSFFSAKEICCITAHQLSTEAKQLIRNGIKEIDFVKEVAGKGYTELTKQIDQIVDGEIYIHIAKHQGRHVLTLQRGKHRIPTIISDAEKYAMIAFEPKAPLRENINDEGGDFDLDNTDDTNFTF